MKTMSETMMKLSEEVKLHDEIKKCSSEIRGIDNENDTPEDEEE
jgi:hypothetical protein